MAETERQLEYKTLPNGTKVQRYIGTTAWVVCQEQK